MTVKLLALSPTRLRVSISKEHYGNYLYRVGEEVPDIFIITDDIFRLCLASPETVVALLGES